MDINIKLLSHLAKLSSFNYNQSSDDLQSNMEEINHLLMGELGIDIVKSAWRAVNKETGYIYEYKWEENNQLYILNFANKWIPVDDNDYEVLNLEGW